MRTLILLCAGLLVAAPSVAFALAESEINDDAASANGPFAFPDTISGTLQGDGAPVTPTDYFKFTAVAGASYKFAGSVTGGSLGADLGLDVENSTGDILVLADANGPGGSEMLNWIAPANGTFYLVVFEATGTPNDISTYSINATNTASGPDTTAPTWPGGSAGVSTAARLPGNNTSANVTWFQASDNVTPQNLIIYDIYYSTSAGTVFSGGVKTTQTGLLAKTVSGLTEGSIYYFGVRARDAANNRDSNTQIAESDPLQNAADRAWALYE